MEEMTVKSVNVLGDTVMAVQDKEGYIWAGVSWLCKALGMSNKQRDNQVAKVQTEKTLKRGTLKFREGVFDQNNEAVGIRIDFIPLWLAKIPITERMEKNHPDLAEKLLQYQLKAKDILAAAFLPQPQPENNNLLPDTIKSYVRQDDIIIVIGEDVYVIEPDDLFLLSKFKSKLHEIGVNQISDVIKAYLSVRFEKLEGHSLISDNR